MSTPLDRGDKNVTLPSGQVQECGQGQSDITVSVRLSKWACVTRKRIISCIKCVENMTENAYSHTKNRIAEQNKKGLEPAAFLERVNTGRHESDEHKAA